MNRYSILPIDKTNDEPTGHSPKQGIIVGPYANEDNEDNKA